MNGRHDQNIGRLGQAAKRIALHGFAIERHIGGHFAFIFKINIARIQEFDRLAHINRSVAFGMTESGISEHGNARLMAQGARRGGALARNIGQLFSARHINDIGVGHHDGASGTGDQHGHAHHALAGARVNDFRDFFQGNGIRARDAGDHGVSIAARQSASAENIAIIGHHALAIAH